MNQSSLFIEQINYSMNETNSFLSMRIIGMYVLVMSRTGFRVNPHSIVTWMSWNSLLERGAKETRTHNHLVHKPTLNHLLNLVWPVWLNGWVFVYEIKGCWFEFSYSHLNFRFPVCSEQGVWQGRFGK